MRVFEFSLVLSAEKLERIYQGRANRILVQSDDGLRLQLPAANFREYVGSDGIQGRFSVLIDDRNRIVELRKL